MTAGAQYGETAARRAVPLALALLNASNPRLTVTDALGRLAHDTHEEARAARAARAAFPHRLPAPPSRRVRRHSWEGGGRAVRPLSAGHCALCCSRISGWSRLRLERPAAAVAYKCSYTPGHTFPAAASPPPRLRHAAPSAKPCAGASSGKRGRC